MVRQETPFAQTPPPDERGGLGIAAVLGGLGLVYLTALRLAPSADDSVAVLIFPPWVAAQDVSTGLSALDLPIRDFAWGGRMVLLDLSEASPATRDLMNAWHVGRALRVSGRATSLCTISRETMT